MANLPDPTQHLTGHDKAIYDDIKQRRAEKGVHHLGPYVPLLNYPELAKYVERLGYFYKYESELPGEIYQFVVLKIAHRSGVEFVWQDHIDAARKAGIPDAIIEAVRSNRKAVDQPYQLVCDVIDCAFRFKSFPKDLQDEAIAKFGMHGFLEIVTLCGFYTLIGMVNASFDVISTPTADHS